MIQDDPVATLTLKNVPQALVARLKSQAKANGRSLNAEILALVKQQLDTPIGEIADELRALQILIAALPSTTPGKSGRRRKAAARTARRITGR